MVVVLNPVCVLLSRVRHVRTASERRCHSCGVFLCVPLCCIILSFRRYERLANFLIVHQLNGNVA